jgi:hypothetical protein
VVLTSQVAPEPSASQSLVTSHCDVHTPHTQDKGDEQSPLLEQKLSQFELLPDPLALVVAHAAATTAANNATTMILAIFTLPPRWARPFPRRFARNKS